MKGHLQDEGPVVLVDGAIRIGNYKLLVGAIERIIAKKNHHTAAITRLISADEDSTSTLKFFPAAFDQGLLRL